MFNIKHIGNYSSNFRGVSKFRSNGYPRIRWRADITYQNKYIYLGLFETPEDAALAYNKKARELHGDKAKLNKL